MNSLFIAVSVVNLLAACICGGVGFLAIKKGHPLASIAMHFSFSVLNAVLFAVNISSVSF